MSSTIVHSNNNQRKTEVTGMGIVFNTKENKYEIQVGQTIDKVLKDHIQEQGEIGISVENAYIEKSGNNTKLVTAKGTKNMKNPQAYEIVLKQNEQRKQRTMQIKDIEVSK